MSGLALRSGRSRPLGLARPRSASYHPGSTSPRRERQHDVRAHRPGTLRKHHRLTELGSRLARQHETDRYARPWTRRKRPPGRLHKSSQPPATVVVWTRLATPARPRSSSCNSQTRTARTPSSEATARAVCVMRTAGGSRPQGREVAARRSRYEDVQKWQVRVGRDDRSRSRSGSRRALVRGEAEARQLARRHRTSSR
jgi:hypothetical protein